MPVIAITAGAAVTGAVVTSNATKNAAKTTTQAAEKASDNSLQAAREAQAGYSATADKNNALAKSIYDQNKGALTPAMKSGQGASDAINAFLGVPTYKTESTPDYEAYVKNNPDIQATYDQYGKDFNSVADFGEWYANHPDLGGVNKRDVPMVDKQVVDTEAGARQQQALAGFRDATGYQDQLDQGVAALDQSAVSRGLLNSGKAVKDAVKFGTGLANQSAGQYLNYLTGQQAVGANATNALTGVGNAYATNVAANNTGANNAGTGAVLGATQTAGNLLTSAADTKAQAGLAGANNISNLLGQAVSAYGSYGGTSSYGTSQYGAAKTSPAIVDAYTGVY